MNKDFYERCKNIVTNLKLSYEQGIARDVILNELDCLEKQAEDYQKRFNKAIEYIKEWQSFPHTNGSTHNELKNLMNILGDDKSE